MTNDRNNNNVSTVIIIILFALLISQYLLYKSQVRDLSKKKQIESIKTNFLKHQMQNGGLVVDSVYAKDDTVKFYNKDSFLGMTVIKEE